MSQVFTYNTDLVLQFTNCSIDYVLSVEVDLISQGCPMYLQHEHLSPPIQTFH